MTWSGRFLNFQPYQFRKADHLCWAIERRLRLAKLQWIAMATALDDRGLYGERKIRVLVRRDLPQRRGENLGVEEFNHEDRT